MMKQGGNENGKSVKQNRNVEDNTNYWTKLKTYLGGGKTEAGQNKCNL